jgi:multiple sugar transport system substrate-binding protein
MSTFSRRALLEIALRATGTAALGVLAACSGSSATSSAPPIQPTTPPAAPAATTAPVAAAKPAATTAPAGGAATTAPATPTAAAAAAANPAATTAPAANTAPANLKGTKITAVFQSGSELEKLYKQEMADFEADTGIKAEYSSVPFENLMDREMTLVGAGSGDIDVFGTHYAQIGRFGDAMVPLNDLAAGAKITADQYVKGSFDAFTVDGKLLALPFSFDMRALFYRTDLFKDAGIADPPKTLDEVVQVAQKLNKPPDVYGYMIVGKGDPALREYSDLLWAYGGDFLEKGLEPSPPAWNSDAGVQALQWWYDLVYTSKVAPPGVAAYGWEENSQLFASGQVAMNKDWGPSSYKDPKASKVVDTFGVTALPAGPKSARTTGVCHGRAINKFSKNKEAAWEFVRWVTAKDQQVKMFNAIQAHPAHIAALQQVTDSAQGIDKLALDAAFARVNDAYTWPLFPAFSQVQPILWGEIEKVLSNQKKPKEALDFAASEATKIFKDANLY